MKNVIIAILAVLVLAEGYFLMMKKQAPAVAGADTQTQTPRPSGAPTGRPPAPLAKGDKLTGSAMEKFAHLVAPGTISADSLQYLTGFTVKTTSLPGGST